MSSSTLSPANFGLCTQLFGDEKTQTTPRVLSRPTPRIAPARTAPAKFNMGSGTEISVRPIQWDPEVVDVGQFIFGRTSFWVPGQELIVKFLDGTQAAKQLVQDNAVEWSLWANINFVFSDYVAGDESDIRVSFAGGVNDSNVGTHALNRLGNDATMHLAQVQDENMLLTARPVILHEFGHALGLLHEHQGPNLPFEWDAPVVYAHYLATRGWPQAIVDANILNAVIPGLVDATPFDPLSIMAYPVPANFLLGGHPGIPWNQELSVVDRATIGLMYPQPPPVPLVI